MNARRARLVALVVAVDRAARRATADPGVTATTITIGGTVPITGQAALFGSVGPGANAYFNYVNAHGGVNGRKIKYRLPRRRATTRRRPSS